MCASYVMSVKVYCSYLKLFYKLIIVILLILRIDFINEGKEVLSNRKLINAVENQ